MLTNLLTGMALAATPMTAGLDSALQADGWSDIHCQASESLILCAGRRDGLVTQVAVVRSGQMQLPGDAVDQAQRLEGRFGLIVVVSRRTDSDDLLPSLGPLGRLTASKANRWLRRAGLPSGCEARDERRVFCRNAAGDRYVSFTVTPDEGPTEPEPGPKRYTLRSQDGRVASLVINDLPASRALLDELPPVVEMIGEDAQALLTSGYYGGQ